MTDSSDRAKHAALILVTGPSGSGKDTLLDGLRTDLAADGRAIFAKRVITRPATAGGEAHTPVSADEFQRRKAAGEFWADWQAHDLYYALPTELLIQLQQGVSVLANVSRTMTTPLSLLWPRTVVIEISAPRAQVNQRLNRRGRETNEEIDKRLQRTVPATNESITTIRISNDSSVTEGIARFHRAVFSILNQNGERN